MTKTIHQTIRKTAKVEAHPALDGIAVAEMTREQWLAALVDRLRPVFGERGLAIPAAIRVSCGWPSRAALGRSARRIGECWSPSRSGDWTTEVFISPCLDDSLRVGDVLVHELVHAAVGTAAGHGPVFRRAALAVGLTGKMTGTVRGPACEAYLIAAVRALGLYPHATIGGSHDRPVDAGKKQTCRLIKVACPSCEYIIRTTRRWLDVAVPTCPACGPDVTMVVG